MNATTPLVCTTIAETRHAVFHARGRGLRIGLVPTMGALHEGHASLLRLARADTDYVVVSIFVNPTQFGPKEDYARYPRPLAADLEVCRREGVDQVFHPTVEVMYPGAYHTYVEVQQLQDGLCGASRPGHFRGVATVVLKLFNIVQPEVAWFGQKDAQQVRILQQMVEDLNVPVEIKVGATVREADGLALSSRNQYLDAEQRCLAPALYQALCWAEQQIHAGEKDAAVVRQGLVSRLEAVPGVRLDYLAIVAERSLQPLTHLQGRVLIALAAFLGTTRLIDNVVVEA